MANLSRGVLPPAMWKEIEQQMPKGIGIVYQSFLAIDPATVGLLAGPDKDRLSCSATCLLDAVRTAGGMEFAVTEAIAHYRWYRECEEGAPLVEESVFWARFYADDAALRFYPTVECLAEFVSQFFDVTDDQLFPNGGDRESQRGSLASPVGEYLQRERPNHETTRIGRILFADDDFRWLQRYRSEWVHGQPPLFRDTGLVWKRKRRWVKNDDRWTFEGVGGDEPELTIEELIERVLGALHAIAKAVAGFHRLLQEESKL